MRHTAQRQHTKLTRPLPPDRIPKKAVNPNLFLHICMSRGLCSVSCSLCTGLLVPFTGGNASELLALFQQQVWGAGGGLQSPDHPAAAPEELFLTKHVNPFL